MQPVEVNQSAVHPSIGTSREWVHWLTLLLLLAAGTAARLLYLAEKAFWFDETFSVGVARLDGPNFLHLLWCREANMSLY